ncbi:MAG: STAS domain-containing protein [Smithella sp.]
MKTAKGSSQKTTLVMNGNLTISQACTTRDEIHKALKNTRHVELDMESVEEVDLSFLQLLCSAHRTSLSLDKILSIKGTIPEVFKKSIEDNGFMRERGCKMDSTNTCLWIMK